MSHQTTNHRKQHGCTHNCNQGRACTCRNGDLPNPTGPLADHPQNLPAKVLIACAVVWMLVVMAAPFLAGWHSVAK